MTTDEKPPRLIDDPAFRDALGAVKNEPEMSPDRLARNLRAITPTISQPPPPAFSAGTVALTLAGVAGLAALLWVGLPALFPPSALVATPTPSEEIEVSPTPAPLESPPASVARTPRVSTLEEVPTATAENPLALLEESPVPTPAAGTLAQELALYEEARDLAKSGDHDGALAKLDELARRFPVTTLAPEAAITRAEILVKAHRLDEASALLAKLVGDPVHAGRRAELERTLGDVERERGDCTSARAHYRASLDAGARGDEASAVRRGLGMCEAQ